MSCELSASAVRVREDGEPSLSRLATEEGCAPLLVRVHDSATAPTFSRSIIERHGGELWASADDTFGATFQFAIQVLA